MCIHVLSPRLEKGGFWFKLFYVKNTNKPQIRYAHAPKNESERISWLYASLTHDKLKKWRAFSVFGGIA